MKKLAQWFLFETRLGDKLLWAIEVLFGLAVVDVGTLDRLANAAHEAAQQASIPATFVAKARCVKAPVKILVVRDEDRLIH